MTNSFLDLYNTELPSNPYYIGGGVLSYGSIALIGGEAKQGKSFLLLAMAHELAIGQGYLWGLHQFPIPKAATVLYTEFELGVYALQKRVIERYKTLKTQPPPNLFYVSRPRDMFLDTATGINSLTRHVEEVNADVVIIDPISRAIIGSENSNDDVNTLFRHLGNLQSKKPELSIVLCHHFGKPPYDQDTFDPLAITRFRGATKFGDAPDALITIQRQPKQTPEELWRLKTSWTLRQEESPDPLTISVMPGGLITPAIEVSTPKKGGAMRGAKAARGTWGP